MSIINDTLKNLDSRNKPISHLDLPKSDEVVIRDSGSNNSRRWVLMLAIFANLGAGIYFFFSHPLQRVSEPLESEQVTQTTTRSSEQEQREIKPSLTVEVDSSRQKEYALFEKEATSLDNRAAVDIEALLAKAEHALARNRLTRPPQDNALEYYQQVLRLQPDSQVAEAGVARVAKQYLGFVEKAHEKRELGRLADLLARAEEKSLKLGDVSRYQAAIAAAERIPVKDNIAFAPPDDKPSELSDPIDGQLTIEKTLETRDREMALEQSALYQRGKRSVAKSALSDFVQRYPAATQSKLALLDIVVSEGDIETARSLQASVEEGSVLRSYIKARLSVAAGQLESAVVTLQTHSFSDMLNDYKHARIDKALFEKYNSLLAALYQRQAQPLQAAEKYQFLLSIDSANTDYWLGYALSSDALQDNQNALVAYRQILRLPGAADKVQDYARKRVDVLASLESQTLAGTADK